VVGTPRCGVPVRQDGTNVVKAPFFRRLTLRSATGTAQRAIPALIACERHNPTARTTQLALLVDQLMPALQAKPPMLAGNVFIGWRGAGV